MTETDLERVVHLAYQILTNERTRQSLLEGMAHQTIVEERLREMFARDECEFCQGAKGGVRGNENRFSGITVCDYCTPLILRITKEAKDGSN